MSDDVVTAGDVIAWVEGLKGGRLNPEEGVHHGRGDVAVRGVTVCWKASPGAIAAAAGRGDELIVGHESLHYPYYFDFDPDRTPDWREWRINTQRMERLDAAGLSYLRLHSTIDWLCIITDMAKWLGLTSPDDDTRGWDAVYEIPETTVRELVERAKRASGLPYLRVSAPLGLDVPVRTVGLLPGGAALVANGGAFEPGIRAGIDCFIAGETDNYGFRYAAEMGIPLIETSHELCENPGFRHFSEMLAAQFPALRVTWYENRVAYDLL